MSAYWPNLRRFPPEPDWDPPEDEPPVFYCAQCGGGICIGDIYFATKWGPYCKTCAWDDEREAEW